MLRTASVTAACERRRAHRLIGARIHSDPREAQLIRKFISIRDVKASLAHHAVGTELARA